MDDSRDINMSILDLLHSVMKITQARFLGVDTETAIKAYLLFPDKTVKVLHLKARNHEEQEIEFYAVHLICKKLGVIGVVTAGIQFSFDKAIDKWNIPEDLKQYGHIGKIPGCAEVIAVAATLPGGLGPCLVCDIQRDDNFKATGFGPVRSVKSRNPDIPPPWVDVQLPAWAALKENQSFSHRLQTIIGYLILEMENVAQEKYH